MSAVTLTASGILTGLVLMGCFEQFAHYRLKGIRSRNLSYLLAAGGLFFFFLSLLGTAAVQQLVAGLAEPGARFGCFLAGCALLLGAVVMFLYLTYFRPGRLRFEDQIVGELPQLPPD
ncbi:MAG TPA: hypothetical protein VE996_12500 [Terriglobales bacterium]|nr:hypothetical protein [Terriglobales bacterium]